MFAPFSMEAVLYVISFPLISMTLTCTSCFSDDTIVRWPDELIGLGWMLTFMYIRFDNSTRFGFDVELQVKKYPANWRDI